MPAVELKDSALWVGDERVPLFAGEMHYWRLNPARWAKILDRMRGLGLNVLATYVPWEYHELAPGQFDFDGRSEPPRNLSGFLDLLRERGFWVFIRPGPFIYSEWTNAGVPDRVVRLPRLSAAYRREAEVWMRAVTEVLRPHLATRGGRIVLFQPDNEMDLFSHWFEDECGLSGAGAGFFQQFLQQAYGDVAALNAAWGTHYESFDQAQALAATLNDHDPHAQTRHKDYWRFQHWGTAEGIRWHVDTYRQLGVDVPMIANYYPGGDVQNWRAVARTVDLTGIDWYPRNEFGGTAGRRATGAGAAPATMNEHRCFLDTCRCQRAYSPLPCIAEFESGVWHGYHDYVGVLTPNHYRLLAFSALLAGIQAWNWYMFVGRDNWYYCPVSERGDARPELAEVFLNIHRVVRECDPPTLKKLTQAAVLLEPLHIGTDNALAANGALDACYAADVDFEFLDPELSDSSPSGSEGPASRPERPRRVAADPWALPLLFYSGADWLSRASQARLVRYMEDGGTLVVFQRGYPQRDEHFQPHNGLGVVPPDRVLSRLGKKVELSLGTLTATAEGAVWNWDRPPGEPIVGTQVAGRQQAVENADKWMTSYIGKRWICGYRQPRGKGALIVIGLPVNADLVRAVHRWLGLPLYAQTEVAGVQTGLFTRDGAYYLFAANMNDSDVQTRVTLDGVQLAPTIAVTDLWSSTRRVMARDSLVITLPRFSGGAWRIER